MLNTFDRTGGVMKRRITAGAIEATLHEAGTREAAVVFFPSLVAGAWMWDSVLQEMLNAGVTCLVIEEAFATITTRGRCLTPLTDALCQLMRAAGSFRYIAFGNSIAGLVALDAATRYQDLLCGVVASGVPGLGEGVHYEIRNKRKPSEADGWDVANKLFHDKNLIAKHDIVPRSLPYFQNRKHFANIVRYLLTVRRVDTRAILAAVQCPVMLIWGAEDRVAPVEPWRQLAKQNSNLILSVIPNCGHSPMIEQPSRFSEESVPFVADLMKMSFASP